MLHRRIGGYVLPLVAALLVSAWPGAGISAGATIVGDVLAGSIVCHLHLTYDHTFTSGSGTDTETVSASGRMDVSYSFIFVGAGSPVYEHARFTYTGSYRDIFPVSQTDARATAAGSLDAPSSLHPDDAFGENEISQQPGRPYSIGPFGGPIPVTGTWKRTYTSGSNIETQASTLHGAVQAYDASMRGGTVPGGEHPALSGTITRQVKQDTLNQGVPEIPPGLAPATIMTGYNRCIWHLVFIVFDGRPVQQQTGSVTPTPAGTAITTVTATPTPQCTQPAPAAQAVSSGVAMSRADDRPSPYRPCISRPPPAHCASGTVTMTELWRAPRNQAVGMSPDAGAISEAFTFRSNGTLDFSVGYHTEQLDTPRQDLNGTTFIGATVVDSRANPYKHEYSDCLTLARSPDGNLTVQDSSAPNFPVTYETWTFVIDARTGSISRVNDSKSSQTAYAFPIFHWVGGRLSGTVDKPDPNHPGGLLQVAWSLSR